VSTGRGDRLGVDLICPLFYVLAGVSVWAWTVFK